MMFILRHFWVRLDVRPLNICISFLVQRRESQSRHKIATFPPTLQLLISSRPPNFITFPKFYDREMQSHRSRIS